MCVHWPVGGSGERIVTFPAAPNTSMRNIFVLKSIPHQTSHWLPSPMSNTRVQSFHEEGLTHPAIVTPFGNGSAALYVNGKLAQKLPCPVKTADIAATATGIYIGRSNWAADPLFNGAMDNVLVANRIFSDTQIAQLALGAVAPEGPAK